MAGYDVINRPAQYNRDRLSIIDGVPQEHTIEPIDYIEALTTGYEFSGFEGAAVKDIIKYVSRFPFKGQPIEDLKKARFYLDRLIKHEEALAKVKMDEKLQQDTLAKELATTTTTIAEESKVEEVAGVPLKDLSKDTEEVEAKAVAN